MGDSFLKKIEIFGREKIIMKIFASMQPSVVHDSLPAGYTPKSVLLMRQDKLGDMVVTLQYIRALKKALPNCKFTVLASDKNEAIIKYETGFDKIIYSKKPVVFLKSLLKVYRAKPETIVDLQFKESATSTIYVVASRALWRIRAKRPVKLPYNVIVDISEDWHIQKEMEGLFETVAPLDYSAFDSKIKLSEREEAFAMRFFDTLSTLKNRRIGVNISAGKKIRMLTDDQNIEICKHLRKKNLTPIVLYGPPEEDTAKKIVSAVNGAILSPKTKDILESCALVKNLAVLITPDTSQVHIASAYGIPTFAMFTANEHNCKRWLPWGVPYRYAQSKAWDSMEGIDMSEILTKLDELIKELKITAL
jgi:heptosyltransferase III